jgi:hypothetical protein
VPHVPEDKVIEDNLDHAIEINFCGNPDTFEPVTKCAKLFDESRFRTDFEALCYDKDECVINEHDYLLTRPVDQLATGLSQDEIAICMNARSSVYQQYKCGFHEDQYLRHQRLGVFLSCLGVFISYIFRYAIYLERSSVELDQKMVDVKSMTTADFSVKIFIT